MRKLILIAGIVIFSACNKETDYTCVCEEFTYRVKTGEKKFIIKSEDRDNASLACRATQQIGSSVYNTECKLQ